MCVLMFFQILVKSECLVTKPALQVLNSCVNEYVSIQAEVSRKSFLAALMWAFKKIRIVLHLINLSLIIEGNLITLCLNQWTAIFNFIFYCA